MGEYKDKQGTTRIGDFLRKLGPKAGHILNAAGDLTGQPWLNAIGKELRRSEILAEEEKQLALDLLRLDYADLKDARDMQKVALQQDDLFSKRFVYYLAALLIVLAIGVMAALFIIEIPERNRDLINISVGFIFGTGFASVVTYFFGSSKGSADKNTMLNVRG